MRRLDAPLTLVVGAALVLVANTAMLAVAAWNRSGVPEASLDLTEREVTMPLWREPDDSSLSLSLTLGDRAPAAARRIASIRDQRLASIEMPWFDAAKLRALGFDLAAIEATVRESPGLAPFGAGVVRRAFVVLEYDGPSWRAFVDAREAEVAALRARLAQGNGDGATLAGEEALLALDRTSRSRLVPIDAGRSAAALRVAHPDRARCAVVPADFGVRVEFVDGRVDFFGRVEAVSAASIGVPRTLRAALDPFGATAKAEDVLRKAREDAASARWPPADEPRYRATLNWGRNFDPWISDAGPLRAKPAPSR